jgi:signal transduction histidine kinase/CheY-like chemotaxis protein
MDKRKDDIKKIISKTQRFLGVSKKQFHAEQSMETDKLLQEFRNYESEIEMQNEELRRVANELEIAKQNYLSVFMNTPLPFVILNKDQKVFKYNNSFQELLNGCCRVNSGYDFTNLINNEHQDVLYFRLRELLENGRVDAFEIRLNFLKDRYFIAQTNIIKIDNEDKILLTLTDITDKVKLAQDNERANKAKSAFLSAISHEMRTPLNPILGFSELLLSSDQIDEDSFESLYIIKNSATKLLALINNIIYLSSIEAGGIANYYQKFSLRKTINDTLNPLKKEAENLGHKFVIDLDEDLPDRLTGDPEKLGHILEKITSNAIKFTERNNSKISVMIKKCDDNTLEINDLEQICLHFTVKDQAIGISKENLDSIFDIFSQVDNTHTRKYDGTGLGLSIVKSLIEMINGRIKVESKLNEGSVFEFFLPFDLDKERYQEIDKKTPEEKPKQEKSISILIAEDDLANLSLFRGIFNEANGFNTTFVKNGKSAIDSFLQNDFDIVLMDIRMPIMDGLESTRRIRQIEKESYTPKEVPIIGVSAYITGFNKDDAISAGMNDLYYKPLDYKSIVAKIKELIKR